MMKNDKDEYMIKRFLGVGSKYFAGGLVGSFFVDRMIAAIYAKISRK